MWLFFETNQMRFLIAPQYRISLFYLIFGCAWIFFTDQLLADRLVPNSSVFLIPQLYKGWFFVVSTAFFLYWLLNQEFRTRARIERKMRIQEAADAVKRQSYEEQLRYQASLLDQVSDAIISTDSEYRIQSWNRAAELMYGWRESEVLGRTAAEILIPTYLDQTRSEVLQAFQTDGVWQGRVIQKRKDGTELVVQASVRALTDASGNFTGGVTVNRDLTQILEFEAQALEQQKLQLALQHEVELRQFRSQFMAMVSHEFRTPLTTIAMAVSNLELYSSRISEEAKHDKFALIQAQITHLTAMLSDISFLLKHDNAQLESKLQSLDFVLFCSRLVQEAQLRAQATHQLCFESQVPTLEIRGDEMLLRQALSNLLENAVKYSPEGGEIKVSLRLQGEAARLEVQDNGIGIPESSLPQIFDPFYRADNVNEISGTGLGLAVTKRAVVMHGGEIQVRSTPGKGTIFSIDLPISDA
jgi:PAS domain S-box-containing protein